ncbi:hypothetical protein [Parabacteroides chinchillae]
MKHIYLLIGTVCIFFISACNHPSGNLVINTNVRLLDNSSVLFTKDCNSYLYDIQITDSYIVVLDSKSDSVMQVHTLKDSQPADIFCLRNGDNNRLISPQFVQSDYRSKNVGNQLSVVDNGIYLKDITLSNTGININSIILDRRLRKSVDYNITSKEIYAVPITDYKKFCFYFYNSDSGYYWVDTPPAIIKDMPKVSMALINNLCVNETSKSIVSAFRFTNYVTFYDLQGNIKTNYKFGEQTFIPFQSENKIDVINSVKCFTSIYSTSKYVYCLYDGSTDFTASSKILVFKWNGKHVKTWQVDRNLRCLAVDKNNRYLYAISSNPAGGQDILRYALK